MEKSHVQKKERDWALVRMRRAQREKVEEDKEETRGEGKGIKHRRVGMGFSQKRDLT